MISAEVMEMNATPLTLAATLLLSAILPVKGDEIVVQPQIECVGVFKNGIAVVRASFSVAGPGSYRWDQVPHAIHATFSVDSEAVLTTRATHRLLEEPADPSSPEIQDALAGKNVVVSLSGEHGQVPVTVSGRIWQAPTLSTKISLPSPDRSSTLLRTVQPSDFLILETAVGRQYINRQRIASISAEGPFVPTYQQVEKPVLVFEVTSGRGKVTLSYLTRGITWLPAYHLDITSPTTLGIRQSTVLRNELTDLKDTAVELISGYPNIQFAHVNSPLDPDLSLAAFFQQLGNSDGSASRGTMSQMISSNVASLSFSTSNPLPASAEAGAASTDIHYQAIGKRDLSRGDSLALDIAAATARYTRIVEWQVPELRDPNGRAKTTGTSRETPDPEDQPWDALRFTNPFDFPMTTAPASITEAGKFRGQSLSQWVNPGETTTLRITQALTLHATASETETENSREQPKPEDIATFYGSRYYRITVQGVLQIHNYRATATTLLTHCRFSGKWLDADAKPTLKLLHESSDINPSSELSWTTDLKAGEERALHYRYQVWISY
jgi:hypothetical protein